MVSTLVEFSSRLGMQILFYFNILLTQANAKADARGSALPVQSYREIKKSNIFAFFILTAKVQDKQRHISRGHINILLMKGLIAFRIYWKSNL